MTENQTGVIPLNLTPEQQAKLAAAVRSGMTLKFGQSAEPMDPPPSGLLSLRGEPRTLTDGEYASRELIATLRGSLGRAQERIRNLECAMLDALDNLRDEEPAAKRLRLELTANEEAA